MNIDQGTPQNQPDRRHSVDININELMTNITDVNLGKEYNVFKMNDGGTLSLRANVPK